MITILFTFIIVHLFCLFVPSKAKRFKKLSKYLNKHIFEYTCIYTHFVHSELNIVHVNNLD